MLGIVALYFIGKAFYKLAESFGRHPWGMAIAGLAVYFGSKLLLGVILVISVGMDYEGNFEGINEFTLIVIELVFSVLATWGFYTYLKKSWRKTKQIGDYELLDEDLTE